MICAMIIFDFRPSRLCTRVPDVRQLRGSFSIPQLVLKLDTIHSIELEVLLNCKELPLVNPSDPVSILVRHLISAFHWNMAR